MESDVLISEDEVVMGESRLDISQVYVMATQITDVNNPKIVKNYYDLFVWDGQSRFGRSVGSNIKYEVIAGTAAVYNPTTGQMQMNPIKKYHPSFLRDLIRAHSTLFYGTQQMFDGGDPFENMRYCFKLNSKLLGSAMRVKYHDLVQMQTYLWRIQKKSYKKYSKLRAKQQRAKSQIINEK